MSTAMVRTTLTLDADLARALKHEAHRTRQSFRDVVNLTLRRGLQPSSPGGPATLPTHALGLPPETSAMSANKLNDLLETEHFARRSQG